MRAFKGMNKPTDEAYKFAAFYNEINKFIEIYDCENKNAR